MLIKIILSSLQRESSLFDIAELLRIIRSLMEDFLGNQEVSPLGGRIKTKIKEFKQQQIQKKDTI